MKTNPIPFLAAACVGLVFADRAPLSAAETAPAPEAPASNAVDPQQLDLDARPYLQASAAAAQAIRKEEMPDIDLVKAEFEKFAAKYPNEPISGEYAAGYIRLQKMAGADDYSCKREWEELTSFPSAVVKKLARKKLREIDPNDKYLK